MAVRINLDSRNNGNDRFAGFDVELSSEQVDPKYNCPICLLILRDSVQTKCGHRFCKSCLDEVCRTRRFVRCPADNSWLDKHNDIFEDIAMRREVQQLTVCCHYNTEGCQWTGELASIEDHERICDYVRVSCDLGCSERILKLNLNAHKQSCPLRPACCPSCGDPIPASDLTKHQVLSCMKFPVVCTLCGQPGLQREAIVEHMNSSCPSAMTTCCLSCIGCQYKDKRSNMEAHYKSSAASHMALACSQLLEVKSELSSLKSQMRELLTLQSHNGPIAVGDEGDTNMVSTRSSSTNGRLSWLARFQSAESDSQNSPCFFTSKVGYKVFAKLWSELEPSTGDLMLSISILRIDGPHDATLDDLLSASCQIIFYPTEGRYKMLNLQMEEGFSSIDGRTSAVVSARSSRQVDNGLVRQETEYKNFASLRELERGGFLDDGRFKLLVDVTPNNFI